MNHSDRHIFLYAKGWYKSSCNRMGDLRQLLSVRSGLRPEQISEDDICIVLTNILFTHKKNINPKSILLSLVDRRRDGDTLIEGFINEIIYQLAFTEVSDINFELGEPDGNVLPIIER